MIVLGIDPGLAHCGWATVELRHGERPECLGLGVIKTAKAKGKGVLVTDDLHRRGMEVRRALGARFDGVALVCAESISYPRNAATSAMLGRAWGVIDALCEEHEIGLVSASPQAIKKATAGKNNASKDDVIAAVGGLVDGGVADRLDAIAKTRREHPADALGAVVACMNHDAVRMTLRASAMGWG